MTKHQTKQGKQRIANYLLLTLLSLLAIIVGNIILTILLQNSTKAGVIDLSGRNRMLSQKIVMLAQRYQGGDQEVGEALLASLELHDHSINVLQQGGIAQGFEIGYEIPAPPLELNVALNEAAHLWQPFLESGMTIYHAPAGEKAKESLAFMQEQAEEMLKRNNAVVKAYKQYYDVLRTRFYLLLLLSSILALIPIVIGYRVVWNRFHRPAQALIEQTKLMAEGHLVELPTSTFHDEMGILSKHLNERVATLKEVVKVAETIGNKDFSLQYEPKSQDDELGNALVTMRTQLMAVDQEEAQQHWTSEGLAHFSDLFQADYDSIEALCKEVIETLVKKLEANQGGIFVKKEVDGEEFMEACGIYAWSRQKQHQKEVRWGEGLIGRAWQEQDVLYITEVPEDYVDIASGLGQSNPRALLIVPMVQNHDIVGAIEVLSFRTFAEHEIVFVKKMAESLANTVAAVKVRARTTQLLEDSRARTEQLNAQEEEMRQNMEELEATQEDLERRNQEARNQLNTIYQVGLMHVEYDISGHVVFANEAFLDIMKYNSAAEIIGQHHRMFVSAAYAASAEYEQFWADLMEQGELSGEFERQAKDGSKVFIKGGYSVIKDRQGTPTKIIKFALDITQSVHDVAREEVIS